MTKQVFNLTGGESPVFAWKLPLEIASYKQARLPAGQWINVIKGFAQKGIKLAEIIDSKVNDWLGERGSEQITKEDLAEYVSFALPSIKELRLSGGDAKYKEYSWADAGAMDYNESLFYFPTVTEDFSDRIADLDEAISALNFDFEKLGNDPDLPIRLDQKRSELLMKQRDAVKSFGGPTTHFASRLRELCPDARADFAHLRWSVADMKGHRTLFIHEMQSDWAQKGRANNWAGEYKPAPLVMDTDHWTAFLLRRAMALAVETGCGQMTWINGKDMVNGGVISGANGLDEFYQRIVPGVAKKLAKPYKADLYLSDVTLRGVEKRLACMPITMEMKEKLAPHIAVYSYARVVAAVTYNETAALKMQRALQLRSDRMFTEDVAMRVSVVRDIFNACDNKQPAGALVSKVAQIAFSAEEPFQALDHEAFHFAYRYRFNSRDREQVTRHFSAGAPLMVRTVRLLIADGNIGAARQASQNPEEAAAHAFSFWRKGSMSLEKVLPAAETVEARIGISNVIAKFFPAAEKYVASIISWMRSSATSPVDFMAKIVRAHGARDFESEVIEKRIDEFFMTDIVDDEGPSQEDREMHREIS